MDPNNQPRDRKGRYLRKKKSKKEVIRVTSEEKEELALLRELKREQVRMQLTPHIHSRIGKGFKKAIFETLPGTDSLDLWDLEELIRKLKLIKTTLKTLEFEIDRAHSDPSLPKYSDSLLKIPEPPIPPAPPRRLSPLLNPEEKKKYSQTREKRIEAGMSAGRYPRRVVTKLVEVKKPPKGKIILLGLSGAGKTSIQDVVFGGKAPEETQNYAATLNYERQIEQVADEAVTVMDLGGQEVFLKRFLSSMSSFIFSNVAVLVFVCDISTPDKFPQSLKAFDEGVTRLEEMADIQPAIYVLLHKTDLMPDLTQRAERMELLMELFQDAAANKNITFLQTSIYDNSIHEAFKRVTAEASEAIPEVEALETEEDLAAIQKRLRLRPIQQLLHALMFMNRLDEVLLISLEDPEFRVHASDAETSEIQQIITLLDKTNDLRLVPSMKSELTRLESAMMYRTIVKPHYLLILFSHDAKSMLETRKLQEVEETVRLLTNQLETMLQSPA